MVMEAPHKDQGSKPPAPKQAVNPDAQRSPKTNSHTEKLKDSVIGQAKASNTTRRVLAVFINEGPRHALRVCQIAKSIKADYYAVYSAIRRFCKYGFVKKRRKGFGKTYYVLADKEAALEYLGSDRSDLAFFGQVPTSPFVDWGDLGRAFYEGGPTRFRVDGYVCGEVRGYLEGLGNRASSRDRSGQLSFACESFSLVITKGGHVTLWIKSREWIRDFFDFLVGCGLDEGNRAHVFRKLAERISDTRVRVEAPVLSDDVPKVTIETRVGDERLVSRICSSHYPKELEVSGSFGVVQNFLSALAGVQHFSTLEWVQADRLEKILRVMQLEARAHERVAEAIESLIGKPAQEREPESKRRRTNYVA